MFTTRLIRTSYYLRTVGMLDSPWDFKQWQLSGDDVVIIGLGSNDYSQPQQYWPTYEQFYQGYATLITFIQQSYNTTG
jgi:lysophospholipase L1-like esterase